MAEHPHTGDAVYQAALAHVARHADVTGCVGLAERLLADGGSAAWCHLAARTDVPEPVAVAAAERLVPGPDARLPFPLLRALLGGARHPRVELWLAGHLGAGLDELADVVTDPVAVATVVRRAFKGTPSPRVWVLGTRAPTKGAQPLAALARLARRAEVGGALTAAGFAQQAVDRLASCSGEYKALLVTALLEYGDRHPDPVNAALRTCTDLTAVCTVADRAWLDDATVAHLFTVLLDHLRPRLQPTAQESTALGALYPRLTSQQRTRLRSVVAAAHLRPKRGADRRLLSLTAGHEAGALDEVGTWVAMTAAEAAETAQRLAYRVTEEVRAHLVARPDVDTGVAVRLALTTAAVADRRRWVCARPFDAEFLTRVLADTPALAGEHDDTVVVSAMAHRFSSRRDVADPSEVAALRDAGVAQRLGPDGVWKLPWPALVAWAEEDDTVARWVADRLAPVLCDPAAGPVARVLLRDTAASSGSGAAHLLDAAVATAEPS